MSVPLPFTVAAAPSLHTSTLKPLCSPPIASNMSHLCVSSFSLGIVSTRDRHTRSIQFTTVPQTAHTSPALQPRFEIRCPLPTSNPLIKAIDLNLLLFPPSSAPPHTQVRHLLRHTPHPYMPHERTLETSIDFAPHPVTSVAHPARISHPCSLSYRAGLRRHGGEGGRT